MLAFSSGIVSVSNLVRGKCRCFTKGEEFKWLFNTYIYVMMKKN
jgi:hypothetical protein